MKKSKAREFLDKDRDFILWLFDNKCVRCGRPAWQIHEIIPISHGKEHLLPKNRVPLCYSLDGESCHSWAHDIGTKNSIPILQTKRKEFLIRKFQLDEQDLPEEQSREEVSG